MWKIPDLPELGERRRIVQYADWAVSESVRTIGFGSSSKECRYVPMQLDTPAFRLHGHNSIVNNAIIHPHFPQIITSGVERHVVLHNPTSASPNTGVLELTSKTVRRLRHNDPEEHERYLGASLRGPPTDDEGEEGQDRTITFFDGVIRDYEDLNLFTSESAAGSRYDSSDSEEGFSESSSEDSI